MQIKKVNPFLQAWFWELIALISVTRQQAQEDGDIVCFRGCFDAGGTTFFCGLTMPADDILTPG